MENSQLGVARHRKEARHTTWQKLFQQSSTGWLQQNDSVSAPVFMLTRPNTQDPADCSGLRASRLVSLVLASFLSVTQSKLVGQVAPLHGERSETALLHPSLTHQSLTQRFTEPEDLLQRSPRGVDPSSCLGHASGAGGTGDGSTGGCG